MYQYALRITPDEVFDASIVHDILATKHRFIYRLLGTYAPSGKIIYTLNPLEHDLNVETVFRGSACTISVEKSTET